MAGGKSCFGCTIPPPPPNSFAGSVLYGKRASRCTLSKQSVKNKKQTNKKPPKMLSLKTKAPLGFPQNVSHVSLPVVERGYPLLMASALRNNWVARERRGGSHAGETAAATRACRARPAGEPSTYVLLLIILTYMLPIMSQTSFNQAYSLLAIYVSTALPWKKTPTPLPPTPTHLFPPSCKPPQSLMVVLFSLCFLFCSHVSRPYVKLVQAQDEPCRVSAIPPCPPTPRL